jgi:hypothetical protein
MTLPYGLLGGIDPSQIPFATQDPNAPPGMPPLPFAPKPSIIDRLAARLFPTGAYEGLLSPSAQQGLQHQGLLNVGLNLLRQSGPSPYRVPLGAAIGNAISGVDFPAMAQQALQLQAYQSQQAERQAAAQVAARHPAPPNETPQQLRDRQVAILNDLMTIPGGVAIAEKYAPVLAATKPEKPGEPQKVKGVENRLGYPGIGTGGTFLIPYPGAPKEAWTFIPGGAASGKEPIRIPNVQGPGNQVGTRLLDANTLQPVGFVPQVQKGGNSASALMGDEARAAAQRLLESHLTGSQLETAANEHLAPGTAAAVVGGLVRKIAGEEAGHGVTTMLRHTATNQEQQAAGRWADAYISLTPKGRGGSPALRDQIMRTYWPQEGDGPQEITLKAQARKAATAAMVRAVATHTAPSLPGFEPSPMEPSPEQP